MGEMRAKTFSKLRARPSSCASQGEFQARASTPCWRKPLEPSRPSPVRRSRGQSEGSPLDWNHMSPYSSKQNYAGSGIRTIESPSTSALGQSQPTNQSTCIKPGFHGACRKWWTGCGYKAVPPVPPAETSIRLVWVLPISPARPGDLPSPHCEGAPPGRRRPSSASLARGKNAGVRLLARGRTVERKTPSTANAAGRAIDVGVKKWGLGKSRGAFPCPCFFVLAELKKVVGADGPERSLRVLIGFLDSLACFKLGRSWHLGLAWPAGLIVSGHPEIPWIRKWARCRPPLPMDLLRYGHCVSAISILDGQHSPSWCPRPCNAPCNVLHVSPMLPEGPRSI